MRSELSEFSYGFAITAELRDLFWPWVVEAPIFPTLRSEARLGWDVKFPLLARSIFLQFKVADALTRRSAVEWRYYLAPYCRFPLHRLSRSNQHNLLRTLALSGEFVFYVAPRFYRLEEFNGRYRGAMVANESSWIPLLSLPTVSDDQQHHVTYRTGLDVRFASPESEPIRATFDGERWKAYLSRLLETEEREITIKDLGHLRDTLLDVLGRGGAQYKPELPAVVNEPSQVFKDIAYLTRTFFGAEFVLIHEQQG